MYLLKLALRPWRSAPFSQVFSSIAVGILLLLSGFLFWMQSGLKPVLHRLQSEQVLTAYVDAALPEKDESALLEKVRAVLNVTGEHGSPEVKWVGTSEFLKQVKGQYPDLDRELEDLGKEMTQIVPRYISVSGILPDRALEKIKAIPGIESAESSKDRYHHIVGAFSALRWVAKILMIGVCFALFTGLIHLARMNAYLHQDALKLLRFWGGGSLALTSPGMISGVMVGILGGCIALSGWMTLGVWLSKHIRTLSPLLKGMPATGLSLSLILFLSGTLIGLISGLFGSLGAISGKEMGGNEMSGSIYDGGSRD